jgi:hypothetical protein
MELNILFTLVGFFLGVLATLLVQREVRRRRIKDPRRKVHLQDLQKVNAWMESYRLLFEATFPECPELILAHKMLSNQYPHYDRSAPLNLYRALKEYRQLKTSHNEVAAEAVGSLQALSDKRLDRLFSLNKSISTILQKLHLLKNNTLLFPVSFPTDIQSHLKIIDQYREKVFDEFPRKVVRDIDWDKLDTIPPDQLSTIIHPCLKYFQADENISRDRETESRMFDEMQNLSFYRIVAKKEIEAVQAKIKRQEEKYSAA